MADSKITALTAISTVDPTADPLVIVDVSDTSMAASGTTKKSTINQLLGAGGTATLASATISGDLTVDTSTLKVDSTNNRVGIVQASPLYPLHLVGEFGLEEASAGNGSKLRMIGQSTKYNFRLGKQIAVDNAFEITPSTAVGGTTFTNPVYTVTYDGIHTFLDGAGGTRMTLNSTGLGVGRTPSAWNALYKGLVVGGTSGNTIVLAGNDASIGTGYYLSGAGIYNRDNGSATVSSINMYNRAFVFRTAASGTVDSAITWTDSMTLDASGNLLVGKTASNSSVIGAELRPSGAIISTLAASTNADFALYTYSTGAAAARFYVGMSGTVFATNTTISAISDARLKENVQDIDVGLGAILALKPRKFDWKEGKGKNIKGDRGFIAQEFEQVFPQLVDEWADPSPEGEAPYKSVRQDLIPVLVKAIQELAAEVNALKNA
jgi:hypothetical protein